MIKHPSRIAIILIFGAMVSVIVGWSNVHNISPPTIIVLFDGEVAANKPLILPASGEGVVKLDQAGSIQRSAMLGGSAIMLSKPDGGVVSVQFPKHGKKSVDIRKGIIYVTIEQYFGLLKTQVEQVDLTQLQTEKIKNDKQGMTDVNGPSQVSN